MLKGHLKIELHNEETGETEVHEQDNMVTDALNYVIANLVGGGTDSTNLVARMLMPIATKALGGIMLFDGPLTEDPANIHFPSEAHIVAYAGQGTSTAHSNRGSINSLESGETETGYVNVWDFGTSQANGTIQSMALTHANSGNYAYPFAFRNSDFRLHSILNSGGNDITCVPLMYDEEEQCIYYLAPISTSSSDHRAGIYKEYIPLSVYRVADSCNQVSYTAIEKIKEFAYDYSINSSSYLYWRNGYDGYAYLVWTNGGNSDGDGTLKYRTMKVSGKSFDISEIQEVTCPSCHLYNQFALVNNGCVYVKSYDLQSMYVVNLSNLADIKQAYMPDGCQCVSGFVLSGLRHGGAKLTCVEDDPQSGYYRYHSAICYPDAHISLDQAYDRGYGTSSVSSGNYPFMLLTDGLMSYGMYGYWSYCNYGYLVNNYLGTICNLSSPVQKTAAQSMKVTYTLTDRKKEKT